MLDPWVVLPVSFLYLALLFAIAHYGDRRAEQGRSLANNATIYALSLAVYCTSWTFYGSVGRAATSGLDFLTIYLGPTLTFALWWFVLHKIIRISKIHRITSIADFISSRYGKSTLLSGLVTIIAVVGIMPYISLQLQAVATSFVVLLQYPEIGSTGDLGSSPVVRDIGMAVTVVMAIFAILYGTRHIDASEQHEGMVVAVAFESLVKLVAFLAVGIFVTFGLYHGFGDLFEQARALPEFSRLYDIGHSSGYGLWVTLIVLSMAAIICLPRQFQVTVVENLDEQHLRKAVWLFPLYLLVINIFVVPIAMAGLLQFPDGSVNADSFVITLPMAARQEGLALLVFIGGLSAATGMIIVATIALSTMLCNDLVMPVLLRIRSLRLTQRGELTWLLIGIRRGSILLILFFSYIYFRYIGGSYALVSIGLVSFTAAAQFAPAMIGGIFWKGGTRAGALTGLSLGFLAWTYTLLLPSFARSGWIPTEFLGLGPWGVTLLRPYALFGLEGLEPLSHALFWSMVFNIGGYVAVSLLSRQGALERIQAALFVDVYRHSGERSGSRFWQGTAEVRDLHDLVVRFLGRERTDRAFADFATRRGINLGKLKSADAELIQFTERLLAGAIGAASARVMVASVVKGEIAGIDQVMEILDEASHVIEHSHQLEQKSRELEKATASLRAANERLQELDRLKDEFLSIVSHELRTPLTSIRSFSEILHDYPELESEQRAGYLSIIISESERLTRLINDMLDLAKMRAGGQDWEMQTIEIGPVIEEALAATGSLIAGSRIKVDVELAPSTPAIHVDRDRLLQVLVNLLSNAVKFCDEADGRILVSAEAHADPQGDGVLVRVVDNGPGIPDGQTEGIFERFQQAGGPRRGDETGTGLGGKSAGSGLGLAICRQIVEHFNGRIWAESRVGEGAAFLFRLPAASSSQRSEPVQAEAESSAAEPSVSVPGREQGAQVSG